MRVITFLTYFCFNSISLLQQLQALLETLSATEPHYMRCVKPNNVLKSAIFENNNVLQQLRCGKYSISWPFHMSFHFFSDKNHVCHVLFIQFQGVMEAIRISCAGYPTRKTFDDFARRFAILAPDVLRGR